VSVASAPATASGSPTAPTHAPALPGEVCPLCRTPLHPEQEWCLHCGAAARTRLAASPRWKGLIAALAVVVALSLGVLAAALVKLAGGSGAAPAVTRTVTTVATASTPTPPTTAGATTPTTAGGTATNETATTVPGTTTTTGGLSRTSTVPAPSTGATGTSTTHGASGLTKAIRERLRKSGLGKLLPPASTR
jgi:hypothetical protein